MTTLVPCRACHRHVRLGADCPFCGADAPAPPPAVVAPRTRLRGRAALLFAGSIGLATACAEEAPAPLAPPTIEAPAPTPPAPPVPPMQPLAPVAIDTPVDPVEPVEVADPVVPEEVELDDPPAADPGRSRGRPRPPGPPPAIVAPVPAYGTPAPPPVRPRPGDPSMVAAYGGPPTPPGDSQP